MLPCEPGSGASECVLGFCIGRRNNANHGFTLVEMLVVIAIIGILASLLMPSLHKAMLVARQTYCSSQLRQIGINAYNYINDNNGVMFSYITPRAWPKTNEPRFTQYFDAKPHDKRNFVCPADDAPGLIDGTSVYFSYGVNIYVAPVNTIPWGRINLRRHMSETLLFVDTAYTGDMMHYRTGNSAQESIIAGAYRHNDAVNVLYLDGRVALMNSPIILLPPSGDGGFNKIWGRLSGQP